MTRDANWTTGLMSFAAKLGLILFFVYAAGGCALERGGATHDESHHAAAEEEISDLDRTLDDLMDDACEHGTPTYECDECRYEVGMVKVAPDLLDEDGPLRTERAERRTPVGADAHNGEVCLNGEKASFLSPRAAGTVQSIHVDVGSRVRRGEILFTVESPEFAEARSAYLAAQASLKLADATRERERDLYERRICPRKDLLEAEAAREAAAATAQAARERLRACGLDDRGIALLSADAVHGAPLAVRAPFDGTVLERDLSVGAAVEPGQQLLLVGDTSEMWVWASLDDDDLREMERRLAGGPARASVTVPAFPGRAFPGRVDRIAGTIDETTRAARVRVVVPNSEGLLRAGMFARVHLHEDEEPVLMIPAEAVLEDDGREFVFVPADPPYFVRRPVTTGRELDQWVEVTQGLSDGDLVVSRGAFTLKSDVLRSKMGAGCAD